MLVMFILLVVLLAQASAGVPSHSKQYEPPPNVRCVKDSFRKSFVFRRDAGDPA